MGIKIIEDLKALRSNSYEHGIDLREHIASRAIKALEDAYREIDKLESEDLFLRTQLAEKDAEIERLGGLLSLTQMAVGSKATELKELYDLLEQDKALKGAIEQEQGK